MATRRYFDFLWALHTTCAFRSSRISNLTHRTRSRCGQRTQAATSISRARGRSPLSNEAPLAIQFKRRAAVVDRTSARPTSIACARCAQKKGGCLVRPFSNFFSESYCFQFTLVPSSSVIGMAGITTFFSTGSSDSIAASSTSSMW